jgi:hypothetical protein
VVLVASTPSAPLSFFPVSSREAMGFSYHRLDLLGQRPVYIPIRARIVCNANANWNGSRTDYARANGLPGALTRQKWHRPVYVLIEIDMELVDPEPQTFEVKFDREFLY